MQQSSQNKGTEFLIPAYELFDIGVFVMGRKSIGQLDISGGIRYDARDQTAEDLFLNEDGEIVSGNDPDAYHQFTAFHSTFTGISGSIGAAYQFSETFFTKLKKYVKQNGSPIVEHYSAGKVAGIKWETSAGTDPCLGSSYRSFGCRRSALICPAE